MAGTKRAMKRKRTATESQRSNKSRKVDTKEEPVAVKKHHIEINTNYSVLGELGRG